MSDALLVLLIGGSALGLAGVLFLLARMGRPGPKRAPAFTLIPAPEVPPLPRECPPLLFSPHSSRLPSEAQGVLRAWAEEVALQPEFRIVVIGSADTAGNLSRNRVLAKERARAAARVLAAAGIPSGRLDVQWREPQPGRTEREQAALRSVRIRAEDLRTSAGIAVSGGGDPGISG